MRFGRSVLFIALALGSCKGGSSEAPPAPAGPIVGVLELPSSLRSKSPAPSGFSEVEISPAEIHVGGQPVLTLVGGTVGPGDRQGDQVPKLTAALGRGPHAGIALAVSSSLPYETLALALSSAQAAGIHKLAFKVRAPSASETGWLAADSFSVRAKPSAAEQSSPFSGAAKRAWSDFVNHWDDIASACRASPSGSCAEKPAQVADGGDLEIVLHSAGQGVNVDYFRLGAPPPEAAAANQPAAPHKSGKSKSKGKKHKPELIDGVQQPKDIVSEVENAPPATEALFQFRVDEAQKSSSAVTGTIAPVCGSASCGVVVQAERNTLSVRPISLLGAAFPDGTTAPDVIFQLP